MLKYALAAAVVATFAATAHAQDRDRYDDRVSESSKVAWADVLSVDPVYDYVETSRPREECYDTEVEHRDTRGNNAAGTVIGAIVGGALGNTVGKGDGRKAATVAGAVVGGAIGNNASRRDDRYYTSTETRCRSVNDYARERRVIGYDVQYRYRGDVYMSHLNYDPGERMRVRVSVAPAE
ncbi:glycine zipper 2TM domain-containing protein [Dokdonella sp. MW10]|uniref:glycine zipper 2TM domain-containing protein n=1 Tax=Dokdonella sp. MW10 TaxID=2992926 RepID=UPI003F7D034F